MKPDDRYEEYAEWEDDFERVEKIRRPLKGKGITAKGPDNSRPRQIPVKKNRQSPRPGKF